MELRRFRRRSRPGPSEAERVPVRDKRRAHRRLGTLRYTADRYILESRHPPVREYLSNALKIFFIPR